MSFGITIAVAVLSLVCAVVLLLDLVRGERRRAGIGFLLLIVFLIVLYLTTGFPWPPSGQLAFGGSIPSWWAIVSMAIGVVFGMAAQYVWSSPKTPSFMDFLRPIVISPLVLLPLVGSLQNGPLETIQLASLALLAFQNGFFWQQVLKDAKPKEA